MNIGLAVVSKSTSIARRMKPLPRFATSSVREKITAALRDRRRRFLDANDNTSRNYLEKWGITADGLFAELAADLKKFQLYLKPNTTPQRYQYVLPYPEEDGLPALLIHITLSAKGDPPRVKVSVHPHNTGHAPLPRVPIS
jgi:hypothetical protein